MNDFKLKLILSVLGAVVFSLLFILLAFALPLDHKKIFKKKPTGRLEKISHSVNK